MSTRILALNHGQIAIVDDRDYEIVRNVTWFAIKKGNTWYATGRLHGRNQYLHRVIMEAQQGQIVDHIDGDGLNNSRSNLRLCTIQQNVQNRRGVQRNNSSGYLGVCKHQGRFKATICADGKTHYLGMYATAEEAAFARDDAAIRLHGEFAATNAGLGLQPSQGAHR